MIEKAGPETPIFLQFSVEINQRKFSDRNILQTDEFTGNNSNFELKTILDSNNNDVLSGSFDDDNLNLSNKFKR